MEKVNKLDNNYNLVVITIEKFGHGLIPNINKSITSHVCLLIKPLCFTFRRMENICLPTGSYAIGFLARTGTQGQSDIGLDDISLVEDKNCTEESLNTTGK